MIPQSVFVMCVETAGMNGKHWKYMCITKQATKRGILGIALNAGKYVLREKGEINNEHNH